MGEQMQASFKEKCDRGDFLSNVRRVLLGLFVFASLVLSQSQALAAGSCKDVFVDSQKYSVGINVRYGLNDAQAREMVEDAYKAAAFAEKHFRLPKEISLNLAETNDINDAPSYDSVTGRIKATYLFGLQRDGKFVAKSRRHARDIFNHEFGHLVFEANIGTNKDWEKRYSESYIKVRKDGGPYLWRLQKHHIDAHFDSYSELFADIFAVAISQNPRAMSSAEYFTLMNRPLHGFRASREALLRSRDFLHKTDLETWHETEVHIRFSPTRSAFIDDPHVAHLLRNDPQHLVRLAFDAIQIELGRLFGDEVAVLSSTTVPELNRRLIKVMKEVLEADRAKRE